MQPLYTDKQFQETKSRELLPLKCRFCQKPFYKKKNDIQWALKRIDIKNCLNVCSRECRNNKNDKRMTVKCKQCNNIIKKQIHEIRTSKYQFCKISCSTKYWNINKDWGTNRSKLEQWIELQLIDLYPSLEIHFNKKEFINSELDIYIPSLKLAFELNGIFHYESIFSEEKLKRTQNNDQRKFQSCLEKGIELCVIDTSSQKYFKENNSKKFLNIVMGIIERKMAASVGFEPTAHS